MADLSGPIIAAIDAGGTTFKCALIESSGEIIDQIRVPTTTPDETIAACVRYFSEHKNIDDRAECMGIASFGPLDIDTNSKNYGAILDGPKSGWAGVNLKDAFEMALNIPVAVDTDVNGALLAEMEWGAAKGCKSAVYMTIGTGIGAGIYANGDLLGQPSHPEFGHIQLKRHPKDSEFEGVCELHGDCLEGLASAPALLSRYGDPEKLPHDHVGWEIIAYYLAQACLSLSLTLRPERLVLGGGIMLAPHLITAVRQQYAQFLNGYLGQSSQEIDELITTPGLGDNAGVLGGVRIAQIRM